MFFRAAASSVLLALLLTSQVPQKVDGQKKAKVPLSCSVIMFSPYDYTSDKCVNSVINARQYCGGKRINFIPTVFWWQANNTKESEARLDKFCMDSGRTCKEATTASIATFKFSMVRCFQKAVELGFTTIEVVPHLDDAEYLHWRATLNFKPMSRYGRYRYYDVVLKPLSEALNVVLSPDIQIYFSLVGEMSGTVFRSARDWVPVLKIMKKVVGGAKKKVLAYRNVRVGLSVNWDKLCGCYKNGVVDPVKYFKFFQAAHKSLEKRGYFNSKDVQLVYNTVDFVGTSYYPYGVAAFTQEAFETSARLFAAELALYGVDLAALIARGVELRFHEYGAGGGLDGALVPAKNVKDLLTFPFFGVGGTYQKQKDPFELWRPESAQNEKRQQLRKFYQYTLKWLGQSGGPTFKVSAVYLWNSGSWDVTGVSPDSTNGEGSWRDPYTSNMIKAYNDKGIVPKQYDRACQQYITNMIKAYNDKGIVRK